MMDICAQLNSFARKNALVESSSDDELLRCLENQRQIYAKSADTSEEANNLAEIKSQYDQHLSKAMGYRYNVEDVPKLVEQLYKLPMRGQDVKNIVDAEEKVRLILIEEARKPKQIIKMISGAISFLPKKFSVPRNK